MARVYVAVQRGDPDHGLVAVKRLHPHLRDDPRARKTLLDEARLAGNVRHPNVLRVHGTGKDSDGPYLAMEYIEGVSLAELSGAVKRWDEEMPLQVCVNIARQIALGLHAIHEQAGGLLVVHRDVSPHNVLIAFTGDDDSSGGRVCIADFGIAKRMAASAEDATDTATATATATEGAGGTSTGVLKGKVGYMSPEQLRFETPDRRADLFALGVVLYELVAGRRLYHGSDGIAGARRILNEPPPDVGDEREDAPPEIVQLLFMLLAKQPQMRPPDAAAVAEHLAQIQQSLAIEEGRSVSLGDYAMSFFQRELAHRKASIEMGVARSQALEEAEPLLGRHASRPPPAPPKWRVKGASIKATLEYFVATRGEEGLAQLMDLCGPTVRAALGSPVLVSTWYDGSVFVAITDAAERLWGDMEKHTLAVEAGEASADFAFGDGGPYEVFRLQGLKDGIAPFLETSAEIYRLYYDVGKWVVEEVTATSATMRIEDGVVFPPGIEKRILGYLRRGFRLIGADVLGAKSWREGDDLLLHCEWRP